MVILNSVIGKSLAGEKYEQNIRPLKVKCPFKNGVSIGAI